MFFLIIISLLFIIIIFSLFLLIKYFKLSKNQLISLFISLGIIIFIINLEISISSIIKGCKLCFYSIFPTIFPFSFICNLLIYYDGIPLYSKIIGPLICKPLGLSKNSSFAIAASFICGYPLGTKYSTDIYELGYIDKDEYTRLLNIATNCGPIFILGAVASSLLNNIKYGYILLISNYLSIIIIGLITKKKNTCNNNSTMPPNTTNNFGENFKNSVVNALNTTLTVSAFIVLFSLIIGIIKNNAAISIAFNNIESFIHLPKNFISSIFYGSIEITNGCKLISTSSFGIHLKLSLISFLCSFSGLSIIAQSSSFISKHKVSVVKYSIIKLFQGIISFFITFLVSILLNTTVETSSIINNSYNAFRLCIILITALLFLFLLCKIINKLLLHFS